MAEQQQQELVPRQGPVEYEQQRILLQQSHETCRFVANEEWIVLYQNIDDYMSLIIQETFAEFDPSTHWRCELKFRDLLLFTLCPELLDRCMARLASADVAIPELVLVVDSWRNTVWPNAWPLKSSLLATAELLGTKLSSLPSLERVCMVFEWIASPSCTDMMVAILSRCCQLPALEIRMTYRSDVAACLRVLLRSIQNCATFQTVSVPVPLTLDVLLVLCRYLPRIVSLNNIGIPNPRLRVHLLDEGAPTLADVKDVDSLCPVFEKTCLERFSLHGIILANNEVLNAFLPRLVAFAADKLSTVNLYFTTNSMRANYGVGCEMHGGGPNVKSFVISFHLLATAQFERELPVAVMEQALSWRVHTCSVDLVPSLWTVPFQSALANHVRSNEFLARLDFSTRNLFSHAEINADPMASDLILAAARSGHGNLDEMHVEGHSFCPEWIKQMAATIAGNTKRLKRVYGPVYEAIGLAPSGRDRKAKLVQALHQGDHVSRFYFLSRNFSNCRDYLVLEMAPKTKGMKRKFTDSAGE